MTLPHSDCSYCHPVSENLIWRGDRCRLIFATETGFPGWTRVVWNDHVEEFSDLTKAERDHVMDVVAAVEQATRDLLQPRKMNLHAMGTAAPHLHWHIVPRYEDDSHFPVPVWGNPCRAPLPTEVPASFVTVLQDLLSREFPAA